VEKVYLGEMNWVRGADSVMPADATEGRDVLVKLRNTAPASRARLFRKGSDEICLQLEKPEYGIATGQAGVIYDGQDDSHMLGGGWISKAPTKADSPI
jgi:tRNA-specific 2-thiouridylase